MTANEPQSPRCPFCAGDLWSKAWGSGHLKLSGIILAQYDEQGDESPEHLEVSAFTCEGCGYVRLHDPRFVPQSHRAGVTTTPQHEYDREHPERRSFRGRDEVA